MNNNNEKHKVQITANSVLLSFFIMIDKTHLSQMKLEHDNIEEI